MAPPLIGACFVLVVGLEHVFFGVLEMFLWTKPFGRRVFETEAAFAEQSRVLAANQGLYNFFLAAGLLISFFLDRDAAHYFRFFFLACAAVAGLYGGYTVNRRIAFFQAGPALFGLFFLVLGL